MMVSANPLLTGRLTWVGDWNGDAELNGVGAGTGVFEVGTHPRSAQYERAREKQFLISSVIRSGAQSVRRIPSVEFQFDFSVRSGLG